MDKKFIVIGDNGEHDYNVTVIKTDKGKEYSIYNSDGEQWRTPAKGELILKMIDDGNGIKFDRKIGKKMDYHELLALHILLSVERKLDPQMKYQVIENVSLIEV